MRPARRARRLVLGAALSLAVVAGACGGDSDTAGTATPAGPGGGGMTLTIKDFTFSPEPLKVPKGAVVKVTNEDDAAHTVTADDGRAFDTGSLGQGDSKEITLSEAGEFPYHCSIHDYMKGVIQVTP